MARLCTNAGLPDLDDLAHKLMAGDDAEFDSVLAPAIPFVYVAIGAADSGMGHIDQDFAGANFWNRNVGTEIQTRLAPQFAYRHHVRGYFVHRRAMDQGECVERKVIVNR